MIANEHHFHIPVMGTGFSADTPIRVAHFGISSVISIVDDLLLERLREYYHRVFEIPYTRIHRYEEHGRSRRITAYLDSVQEIVRRKLEAVKMLPFGQDNDKAKYFELLPNDSPLRQRFLRWTEMPAGAEKDRQERALTEAMLPGSIDVNIMTKLDRPHIAKNGVPLGEEFTDAKTALKGYAESTLQSALVFSAGLNQALFNYMSRFKDFYHTELGESKKKIILKVSDFRSAIIQGKILAKRGLEVHEYRIESGLNCGGHAFASNGYLLPTILKEFKEKRHQLAEECRPLVKKFYETMGWHFREKESTDGPLVTVQGGIGSHGEAKRLTEDFGADRTGWATPFLLVPEATAVDDSTRTLLSNAKEDDLYVSGASPLGVQFNTVKGSGSLRWTAQQADKGRPGSPCPKGFLVSNMEFTDAMICTASREYQKVKLEQIEGDPGLDRAQKAEHRERTLEKTCLCDHLGNSALVSLGVREEFDSPQSVCPGPNIAWFNRLYTLREMVDHIYGRGKSLVPLERPHMFAKEIVMYVDHLAQLIKRFTGRVQELRQLREFKENLEAGLTLCLAISGSQPNQGENLASIPPVVEEQRSRLERLFEEFEASRVPHALEVGAA